MSDVMTFPLPSPRIEFFTDLDYHPVPARRRYAVEGQLDLFSGSLELMALCHEVNANVLSNTARLSPFFTSDQGRGGGGKNKFRSSNTGTLSHFETETPVFDIAVPSFSGAFR